ncbi:MAG: hypothetical protein ACRD2Q_10310, partial [Terriglobales bacterium]
MRNGISPNRNLYLLMALLATGVLGTLLAGAQAPTQSQNPPAKVEEPEETFRVSVDVVNVFFNVKDKRGALIPGLTRTDFEIYEDGKPQTIKYFSSESNQPL